MGYAKLLPLISQQFNLLIKNNNNNHTSNTSIRSSHEFRHPFWHLLAPTKSTEGLLVGPQVANVGFDLFSMV